MSATINRSLTTVKTELEFLMESEVITEGLYKEIVASLPLKYIKGMAPIDVGQNNNSSSSVKEASPSVISEVQSVASTAPSNNSNNFELAEALYDYNPQQPEDLKISIGDKITVIEKPSDAWWKGTSNNRTGMFPSNYVKVLGNGPTFFSASSSRLPPQKQVEQFQQQPPPQYYQQQPPQQMYYQQPQQQSQQQLTPMNVVQSQPQQEQQHRHHSGFKKFGSKLGDAAIFGAGATIGSDLINSIF